MPTAKPLTIASPGTGAREGGRRPDQINPLYHVVLINDDEHTYEYVVEMLGNLFFLPPEVAYRHAVEVDATGRTIVITCDLPQAEFGRDQIHAYGADPRSEDSKGSMRAVVEPAGRPPR